MKNLRSDSMLHKRSRLGLTVALLLSTSVALAQTQSSPPPAPGEAAPIHTITPVLPPPDASAPIAAQSAPVTKGRPAHRAKATPMHKRATKPVVEK